MSSEFRIVRRVQFAETDMAGVLHFSNYFRLMEEVEHAFWRSLELSVYLRDRNPPLSWPRVAVRCEYLAPLRFEDEVVLHMTITKIGERSIQYEVRFLHDDECCAVGHVTAVCCETGSGGEFTATPIPEPIRRLLKVEESTFGACADVVSEVH
jgi:YbgC/YbaW family acyl-CoA thioester hydrolase